MPPDRLLRPKDACEYLALSRSYFYQLLAQGDIPRVEVGGAVRVRVSDVDKIIEQGTQGRRKEKKKE